MGFLRPEKSGTDRDMPLRIPVKICCALFQRLTQNRSGDFQDLQCIGIYIGGNHIPHGHVAVKAPE